MMTPQERINHYTTTIKLPTSLAVGDDGRIFGIWVMGNNYQVKSSYYGGYPHGYLKRIMALFPDKKSPLHLFSGGITEGETVDCNPNLSPTYVDDAHTLENTPVGKFDLILADPPYSVEDAEHYQTSMVKRNTVLKTLGKKMSPGSHLVWLDQVLPMYRKNQFKVEGYIGMVKSTNHRFRIVTIFRRKE
jgi:hypothetical protein